MTALTDGERTKLIDKAKKEGRHRVLVRFMREIEDYSNEVYNEISQKYFLPAECKEIIINKARIKRYFERFKTPHTYEDHHPL